MTWVRYLPTLNAVLNGISAILLLTGWFFIRRGRPDIHRIFMAWALTVSALFLTSYVTYHYLAQAMTLYPGTGLWRPIYYTILFTHIPLAVLMTPFILAAVYYAVKGKFERHRALTRWVFPVWLYVNITGVVIYLMLYIF
ncbi:MAG: DUF420 domain-containing protein [Candidatus Margulisiibacteriota bacterium]